MVMKVIWTRLPKGRKNLRQLVRDIRKIFLGIIKKSQNLYNYTPWNPSILISCFLKKKKVV